MIRNISHPLLRQGVFLVMRYTLVIPNSGRVAISRKGPAVGCVGHH